MSRLIYVIGSSVMSAVLTGMMAMGTTNGCAKGDGSAEESGDPPSPRDAEFVGEVRVFRPDSHFEGWFKPFPDTTRLLMFSQRPGQRRERFLWDYRYDRKLWRIPANETHPGDTSWPTPNGQRLLFATEGGKSLALWDVASNQELRRFTGHHDEIVGLDFLPDGERFITISNDGNAVVWHLDDPERDLGAFEVHTYRLVGLALSLDGTLAATADEGGNVFIWDVRTCREVCRLPRLVLKEWEDPGRVLRDHTTGEMVDLAGPRYGLVRRLRFSADGRRLALAPTNDPTVHVFDVETGKEVAQYRDDPKSSITALAISPDGQRVLYGLFVGPIRLWDLREDKIVANFQGHTLQENRASDVGRPGGTNALTFTADGKHALSGGEDGTVRLWKLPE